MKKKIQGKKKKETKAKPLSAAEEAEVSASLFALWPPTKSTFLNLV